MGLQICSGISPSLLSLGGSSTPTFFVDDHDNRKQRDIDTSGHPTKRRCAICSMVTRHECSNKQCMRQMYQYDGEEFQGVPLCPASVGPRTHTKKYGAINALTCLQIHGNMKRAEG